MYGVGFDPGFDQAFDPVEEQTGRVNWQALAKEHEASRERRETPDRQVVRAFLAKLLLEKKTASVDGGSKVVKKSSRRYRHGGFYPKPRRGVPDALRKVEKWRHQSGKSDWWTEYIDEELTYDPLSYEGKEFAQLFIVPRLIYEQLYGATKVVDGYKDSRMPLDKQRWVSFRDTTGTKTQGASSQPLRLKILAALMRLRGTKFPVIAKLARISPICLERFYYAWIAWFAETQFVKHVYPPRTPEEIRVAMERYAKVGLPGSIAGVDGVHAFWDKCPASMYALCKGKERRPTVMFNVSSGLNTEVYAMYGPDFGARNDKTAARMDSFMVAIHRGELYADVTTQLYGSSGQKDVTLKGAHLIVDNGYHAWECLVPPTASASDLWKSLLCERVESARKPSSECVFGRTEKRFGVLREPFFEEQMFKIGDVWRVCAALHNMLLRHHRLDTIGDYDSDWATSNLSRDSARIKMQAQPESIPFVVDDRAVGNDTTVEYETGHAGTMAKLRQHYMIAWEKKEVLWPKTAMECRGHRRDDRPLEGARGRRTAAEREQEEREQEREEREEAEREEEFARWADEEEEAEGEEEGFGEARDPWNDEEDGE